MKTAAEAKDAKEKFKTKIANMIAGAQEDFVPNKRRGRKSNPNVRVLSQITRKVEKITHRRELPKDVLERFVAAIQAEYPDSGFNHPKSDEKVLAHYRCPAEHRRTPNWAFILSTSGNQFYFNEETGEIFVGDNNRL
jgi:transcription initiation factor TFIIIB Brf1 subunit/transcription initiation factor TFIIB